MVVAIRAKGLVSVAAALAVGWPCAGSGQERPYNERPYTPSLSCAAVKAIVARRGRVILATSPNAYETVHLDSGACQGEVTARPAFEPTLDEPNCFAGWRCRQRDNDATGTR